MISKLLGLRLRENRPVAPPEQTCTPTTRPENCFAVVDFYRRHYENGKRRKEMITYLICLINGTEIEVKITEVKAAFQRPNPYSANMKDSNKVRSWRQTVSRNNPYNWMSTPILYAAANIIALDLRVDVTMFRRDSANPSASSREALSGHR